MARKGTRKGKRKAKRSKKKTIEQRVSALEKAITPSAGSKRGGRKPRIAVIAAPSGHITPPHVLRQLGMA